MKAAFDFLPRIEGHVVCGTCNAGPKNDLEMDRPIAMGFGSAGYSKNGQVLWQEGQHEEDYIMTVQDVENLAKHEPEHDWRIFFYGPLYESEHQRQGDGVWVLVSKGMGFA